MKVFAATPRDDQRNICRVEFTGHDIETFGLLTKRLEVLLKIEDAMGSVAAEGFGFLGHDFPHVTREGLTLIRALVDGWDGDETVVVHDVHDSDIGFD